MMNFEYTGNVEEPGSTSNSEEAYTPDTGDSTPDVVHVDDVSDEVQEDRHFTPSQTGNIHIVDGESEEAETPEEFTLEETADDEAWGNAEQGKGWDQPGDGDSSQPDANGNNPPDHGWGAAPQQDDRLGNNNQQGNQQWDNQGDSNEQNEDDYNDQQPTKECPGCTDTVSGPEAIYITCGHPWHRDCINDNFHNALQSRQNWPPKCCNGIHHIDPISVEAYLDDEVLFLLMERREEFESPNPIFCSNLSCGKFISDSVVNNGSTYWVTCPLCRFTSCKLCKCPLLQHPMPGVCPTFLDTENQALADREGWKMCPRSGCRTMIERSEGCDTMECPTCKTEFCYRCRETLRGGVPCNCNGQNEWVNELAAWRRGG